MTELVFVQRNASGAITGVYANPQPGYAVEALPDNDASVVAYLNPPPPPITSVTPAQGRIALLNAGLLDKATAAVNTAGGATAIWWEYAPMWERNNSTLVSMATTLLGLTPAQIDQLFVAAAQIN